jgi:hypothetical protein
MIASEGSEKKRAVPSASKPKTLKDCLSRNVSAVMYYNFSRVVNDLFLLRGLQISDELPAILRKPWRSAQALVWTAHVPFGDPVYRTELRQGSHEPRSRKIRPPLDVNLWACKSSLSEN